MDMAEPREFHLTIVSHTSRSCRTCDVQNRPGTRMNHYRYDISRLEEKIFFLEDVGRRYEDI